ncbi:MAG: hypothetical protein BGO98_38645 [Myxococcales bacterium 68-20]|nr:MAG: hypothetical protein BGO98_38645 [Myxococcales bacterium 68-20]
MDAPASAGCSRLSIACSIGIVVDRINPFVVSRSGALRATRPPPNRRCRSRRRTSRLPDHFIVSHSGRPSRSTSSAASRRARGPVEPTRASPRARPPLSPSVGWTIDRTRGSRRRARRTVVVVIPTTLAFIAWAGLRHAGKAG